MSFSPSSNSFISFQIHYSNNQLIYLSQQTNFQSLTYYKTSISTSGFTQLSPTYSSSINSFFSFNLPYEQINKINASFLIQIDYKEILSLIDIYKLTTQLSIPQLLPQINLPSREIQFIQQIVNSHTYQN